MNQKNKIVIRKLPGLFLFKIIFIGFSVVWFPVFLVAGIMSMFGANTIKGFEYEYVHGIYGLLLSQFFFLIWVLFTTALFGGMIYLGLRFFGLFRPLVLEVSDEGP